MRNLDDMTRAELIEIIKSLEKEQPASAAELKISDRGHFSNTEGQESFIPTLMDLDAALSENGSVLKWVFDPSTLLCLAVNDAALDYFGYSRAKFLSLNFVNSFPPGALPTVQEPAAFGDSSMANSETWQYHKNNGEVVFLHVCYLDITRVGKPARLMIANDVSKQYRMEADLERAREWMSRSQIYAKFGIWDWDIQTGITHLSEQIASLFGYENNVLETTREDFLSAVHQDDRQRVVDIIHTCSDCKGDCIYCREGFDIQYRIVKPDGAVRWMHERGGMEQCEDGRLQRILGVVQDITDQKHSEQALRESEELFRLFAENIRETIWIATPCLDKLLYINQAASEIFGLDRNNLHEGLWDWRGLVIPEDLPMVEAALLKQKRGITAEVEVRIVRADGKIRWIRARSFPLKNLEGEWMTSGIAEDVTDRRQLEEEQRVHMLQQRTNLVREVHHRIKNNLQGVAGLLRQQADEHPEVRAIIDQAITQVRAVAVIHGLQGQASDNEVVLCEMVPTIAHTVETVLSPRAVLNVCVDVPQRIRVNEQETVPIALILNELIMNSAKHAAVDSGAPHISISVRWDPLQTRALINIVNPGVLPEGFDFLAAKGIGTGLELVRALLPSDGGKLSIVSGNGQVKAVLELSAPSIYNL